MLFGKVWPHGTENDGANIIIFGLLTNYHTFCFRIIDIYINSSFEKSVAKFLRGAGSTIEITTVAKIVEKMGLHAAHVWFPMWSGYRFCDFGHF